MKIDINCITPRQKLIIQKGLFDYQYIMDNRDKNDPDFQEVYYEFYLKARWAVMSDPGNRVPYFDMLQRIRPTDSLTAIVKELKEKTAAQNYEFSLCSKMLHTRNPQSPIYDSKVREYLSKEEGVPFWWHKTGAPRGTSEFDKIVHDWSALCTWYNNFIPSVRGQCWIDWFDSNFPAYRSVSDIKKIDFIIFAAG